MRSRLIATLLALVAGSTGPLGVPSEAHASVVFVGNDGALNYVADPGEANNLTVGPSSVGGVTTILLTDPGAAAIATGNGCFRIPGTPFTACQIHDPLVWLNVSLGDLDDRFVDTAGLGDCDTSSVVSGGPGDDRLTGGQGLDNLRGDGGADVLSGGPTGDNLEGGPGADFLDGGSGADVLNGGSGTDYADYSSRATPMLVSLNGTLGLSPEVEEQEDPRIVLLRCRTDGDIGEDVVLPNVENVWGGSAPDVLVGNDGRNALFGHGGDDSLDGAGGPDVLDGGEGRGDRVEYGSRAAGVTVTVDGEANDGEPGEGDRVVDVEELYGGSGNDWLVGSPSSEDKLFGGEGDDRLDGGEDACGHSEGFVACLAPMRDRLYGGPHAAGDSVDYSSRDVPLAITLESVANGAAGEYDWIFGVENVTGGASDDYIAGTGSANRLTGGGGADGIYGWGGADYVDSRDWRTDYVYCDAGVDEVFGDDIDVLPTGDCETTTLLSSVVYGGRYRGP